MTSDTANQNAADDAWPVEQPAIAPPSAHGRDQETDPHAALFEGLTEPQAQAVAHTDGPLLIIAAAGSGKTRTLTRRIARLIADGVPPWQIMALTFTNKAATEMRERALTLLDNVPWRSRGLTVTTFHSLCARLLRRYGEVAQADGHPLPVRGDFTIFNSNDQVALVKRVIVGADLSTTNWPPRSVLSAISAEKNKLMTAEKFAASAHDFYSRTIARLFTGYQDALHKANAVDFDDLLVMTASMLQQSAMVRAECQDRWRYLMIDEYQDTNHAQFVIASLLAGDETPDRKPNITVVGDPDQAIYSWRGADIANILEFEENYPSAQVITLGENFRSTEPILAVADTLIRKNTHRKHKDLFTSKPGGLPIQVHRCRDERHESELVIDWFRALAEGDPAAVGDGGKPERWRDMAVFYRTNALSRSIEDALRAEGIPYTVARGTAFYDREEVRNALAYLRVVANPADDVSLNRIVNVPPRGLGKTSLERLSAHAEQAGVPLYQVLGSADTIAGVSARAAGAAKGFVQMAEDWTGSGSFMGASVSTSLAELVRRVIEDSGLRKMYQSQAAVAKTESEADRVDNLDELVNSAATFEEDYDADADPVTFVAPESGEVESTSASPAPPMLSLLRAYLERVALVADADAVDPSQGAVTLMTLHAAKGLEFGAAAIIGLEEGLLPHSRAAASPIETEEERRLCFVGMTRAMRHLLMTSASRRSQRGVSERTMASRFLEELGTEHVVRTDSTEFGFDPGSDEAPTHQLSAKDRSSALTEAKQLYPVGSKVRHPRFGVGTVEAIEGGASVRAKVKFRETGTKTLVLEYARLEPLR